MDLSSIVHLHEGSPEAILNRLQVALPGVHYAAKKIGSRHGVWLGLNQLLQSYLSGNSNRRLDGYYTFLGTEHYTFAERDRLHSFGINPIIALHGAVYVCGARFRNEAGIILPLISSGSISHEFLAFMQRHQIVIAPPAQIPTPSPPAAPQTAFKLLPIHHAIKSRKPPQIGLMTLPF